MTSTIPMPDVLIRQIDDDFDDEIDPELLDIARPIIAKWHAAILRVGVAQVQPGTASLPAAKDSPELLLKRFSRQRDASKRRSGERCAEMLKVQRFQKKLTSFVNLDLASPLSVDQLLKNAAPAQASPQRLQAIADRRLQRLTQLGMPRPQLGTMRRLSDRVAMGRKAFESSVRFPSIVLQCGAIGRSPR